MVSIGEFLDAFGFENLLLIATFLISFALINFILARFLKNKYGQPNKAIAGVIAFAISMLIVYGVHKMGFDLGDFFYDIGISEELLGTLVPLIVLAAVIWLIWKIGICLMLLALGLLLTIVSFTDWVYESGVLLITGIVLLITGLICFWFKKRKGKPKFEEVASPILKSMTSGSTPPSPVETKQREAERTREQEWEEMKRKQEEQEIRLKEAEAQAKKKKRAVYDLKQKYLAYLYEYSRFARKGQEEAAKRKRTRIKQIMNTIIAYAERAGVPKERFLSKEIGRTKAKAPEELKEP